jgi:5-(carboxyamino)imidazole ribonucleotide mutase
MPSGVPVATIGINRAANAALLALQILAVADAGLAEQLQAYKRELAEKGRAADERVAASLVR